MCYNIIQMREFKKKQLKILINFRGNAPKYAANIWKDVYTGFCNFWFVKRVSREPFGIFPYTWLIEPKSYKNKLNVN